MIEVMVPGWKLKSVARSRTWFPLLSDAPRSSRGADGPAVLMPSRPGEPAFAEGG